MASQRQRPAPCCAAMAPARRVSGPAALAVIESGNYYRAVIDR